MCAGSGHCGCSRIRTVVCPDCSGRGWRYDWGCGWYGPTQAVECATCWGSGCIPIRRAVHFHAPRPGPRYRLQPLRF